MNDISGITREFGSYKIIRARGHKPCCLWRLINWWRRITGRDHYYIGVDPAYGNDLSYWCRAVCDTKSGVITILETGRGESPTR